MSSHNQHLIKAARGLEPADLVIRNALMFNPFTCSWHQDDFGIKDGLIIGMGRYEGKKVLDLKGSRVVPGLIDAHVHIESSLLTPREYARLVAIHGTTTVIADPHEIANILGTEGIEYMIRDSENADVEVFFTLPSCVPSIPGDTGGAVLAARDLGKFLCTGRVIGIGEMMDVPGVLNEDPGVHEKCNLLDIVEGHAPLLTGRDLNAYIVSGPESDHECTTGDEAGEKLSKGMFIYLRQGSTECNIESLLPIVTRCSAPRCSFATDDLHVDDLVRRGHIDACIRTALSHGLELETALRLATLSPAERFHLHDRGALVPGRVADFCLVDISHDFKVLQTYRGGVRTGVSAYRRESPVFHRIALFVPSMRDLGVNRDGTARVIGIVSGQITTRELQYVVKGQELPDPARDLAKVVVCSRYNPGVFSVCLVQGFGFATGAIAGSISHDAHNVVAAGANDEDLCRALNLVIQNNGGLVAVQGEEQAILPLENAGLMSGLPYDQVLENFDKLHAVTDSSGSIRNPFMYLSFLCLPVVPELRITPLGLFSVNQGAFVPLFIE